MSLVRFECSRCGVSVWTLPRAKAEHRCPLRKRGEREFRPLEPPAKQDT